MIIKSKNCELDLSWCEIDLDALNEEQREFIVNKLSKFMELVEDIVCTDKIDAETIPELLHIMAHHSVKTLNHFNGYDDLDDYFDDEDEEEEYYNDCPCGFGHECEGCCYETEEGYCDYIDSMPDR